MKPTGKPETFAPDLKSSKGSLQGSRDSEKSGKP